jgi:hypothetical protein
MPALAKMPSVSSPKVTPPSDFRALVLAIAAKPNGFAIALEILVMRIHVDKKKLHPDIMDAGKELLRRYSFTKENQGRDDHNLSTVIEKCLIGEDDAAIAIEIYGNLARAVAQHEAYAFEHDHFLSALFKAQPSGMLDAFFDSGSENQNLRKRIVFELSGDHYAYPFDGVPVNELIEWCEKEPARRYPAAASAIAFLHQGGPSPPDWNNAAIALLSGAPDPIVVLAEFRKRFRPNSWSGSLATAMEGPLPLLRKLKEHPNANVVAFAVREERLLSEEVEKQRRRETQEDRAQDEGFED